MECSGRLVFAHSLLLNPNVQIKRFLFNGTTTAMYHGSLHLAPNKVLVDRILALGQRAVVGKVRQYHMSIMAAHALVYCQGLHGTSGGRVACVYACVLHAAHTYIWNPFD